MSGELRASLLVTANTQAALAAVKALKVDTEQLGAAVRKSGQDAQTGATGLTGLGAAAEQTAAETARAASAQGLLIQQMLRLTPAAQALANVHETGATALRTNEAAIEGLIAAQVGLDAATQTAIRSQLQQATALDAIRAKYDPLFAASRQYELQLEEIAEAERQGALSAGIAEQARARAAQSLVPGFQAMGRAAQGASQYTTQLGFQAQDTFMMIAAGQNPMMTAMQQGTQVVGVFQSMRDQGMALGPSIRGALLSMVSPLSLVTLGVIALGSYAIQALMDSGEAAMTFEDRLKALNDTMSSLRENSKLLADDSLSAKFGAMQGQARQLVQALVELDRASELKQLRTTLDERFAQDIEPGFWQQYVSAYYQGQSPGTFADVNLAAANFESLGTAMSFDAFSQLRGEIDALAADGKLDEVTAKIIELGLAMKGDGQFTALGEGAQKLWGDLAKLALGTAETEAVFNGSAQKEPGNRRADEMIAAATRENELARARLAYGEQSAQVRALEADHARNALETEIQRLKIGEDSSRAIELRAELEARLALTEDQRLDAQMTAADQMLAQYQAEAGIVQLTARYGADSLEVAYARAAAERDVVAAQLEAQGITGQAADDLMAAWDAARGVAAVDMAAGIGAAAGVARLLAAQLGVSLDAAVAIMNLKPGQPTPSARFTFGGGSALDGLGSGTTLTFGDTPGEGGSSGRDITPRTPRGTGGGARAEADALSQLIAEQNRQIEVLKALDPVQAAILQNHEALKDATDAEKLKVSELIAERMRLEEIRSQLDDIEQAGKSTFTGLLSGALSFSDALSVVLGKLIEMSASDLWDVLWSGGSGGGGGIGAFVGSLLGLADGGRVAGPGGPRDDVIPAWLSNGEYVVNAAATAHALPLLEAINAGVPMDRLVDLIGGRRPAYADGGMVGSSAPAAWRQFTAAGSSDGSGAGTTAAPADRAVAVRVYFDKGDWKAEVRKISGEVSAEVVTEGLEMYSTHILPDRMAEVQANPRQRGR